MRRLVKAGTALGLGAAAAAAMALAGPSGIVGAQAATLTVDTTSDSVATPSCAAGHPAGTCTLREAIAEAESGDTVDVDASLGTFTLTQGHLSVARTLAVVSVNGTPVIAGGGAGDSLFVTDPTVSLSLTLRGLKLQNGAGPAGGGAVLAGGDPGSAASQTLTVTGCTLSGNRSLQGGGGAIRFVGAGTLTVSGSTFAGNSATAALGGTAGGGAIDFAGGDQLTISGSVFTDNTSGSDTGAAGAGGALLIGSSGGSASITTSTFTGNLALDGGAGELPGAGGGIWVNGGTVDLHFSRIAGNVAKAGPGLYEPTGEASINATDDWWGNNADPLTGAIGKPATATISASPWLQLEQSATNASVQVGSTSLLTADLLQLSGGGTLPAANLSGLAPISVAWSATGGSIDPASGTLDYTNGPTTVATTFTGTTGGLGGVGVTVDGFTLTTPITVTEPPVIGTGGFTVDAVEGQPSGSQTVATFTDPAGPQPVSAYSALIDWGDGSTAAGTITFDASSGVFTVTGAHTYAEEGTRSVKVTISHDSAPPTTVADSAVIVDPMVTATGADLSFTEGAAATVTVATFTDPGGAEPVADYSAQIDWGDGSTTAGTITFDSVSQSFTVSGTHTYAEEGGRAVQVTIGHDSAPPVSVNDAAAVADPAVRATGADVSFTEGAPATVTLATFTDPGGAEALADYSAQIDWGDGSAAAGTITFDPVTQTFTVSGAHSYAEEGSRTVRVGISHDQAPAAIVTDMAAVVDPAVSAAGANLSFTEGAPATVTVATFTDPGGAEAVTDYSAQINWGDGSTSPGTMSFDPSSGIFTVSGAHTYVEEGSRQVQVTISHDQAAPVSVSETAAIVDPMVNASGASLGFTEGVRSNAIVATFTDPGGAEAGSDYSAQIDWGDGSTSPGAISFDPGSAIFTVSGAHTYVEEASRQVQVIIGHDQAPPATVTDPAQVADPGVVLTLATQAVVTVEAHDTGTLTLATFSDPAGPEPASDYSAGIDWGDGTATAGVITFDPGSGRFLVTGGHTYTDEGSYRINLTVGHDAAPAVSATIAATVADAPLTASAATFQAVEGQQFSGPVASFSDGNPLATASDFTATINWGDGTSGPGAVVAVPGGFVVDGSHTYADESQPVVSVAITDDGGNAASAAGAVSVADAPLASNPGPSQLGVPGQALAGTLATFSDGNPLATVSDFAATINWGDGVTTPGTVTAASGGGFQVAGSHVYAAPGTFAVSVGIVDDGGSKASAQLTATIGGLVLALDPHASAALHAAQTGVLNSSWPIAVDSNAPDALTAMGRSSISGSSIRVVGGTSIKGSPTLTPAPVTGAAPTADPFSALSAPSALGLPLQGNALSFSGPATLSPGLYTGGVTLNPGAAVTLNAGVYVLQGGGLAVNGGTLTGNGVVLVLEASPGTTACGAVVVTGGSFNVAAPASGTGAGLGIWVDRACASGGSIQLIGGSATVTGGVYDAVAGVIVRGSATVQVTTLVAETLDVEMRARLTAS